MTQTIIFVAIMIAFVAVVALSKRGLTAAPPPAETFSRATWGNVLEAGEEILGQAAAYEPRGWWTLFIDAARRPPARARQLALTSGGAFLLADSGGGGLSGRERHLLGAIQIESIADKDQHAVALALRIAGKRRKLHGVPRPFFEALRASVPTAGGARG